SSETASCDSPPDTVTAETTPAAQATATVGGTVPATISFSLGAPASFGAFTPCVTDTYSAGVTANLVSTDSGATLAVYDASAVAPCGPRAPPRRGPSSTPPSACRSR